MPQIGDVLIGRFTVVDGTYQPLTNASFTMQGRDPGGNPITVDPPVHLGDGIYEVRYQTSIDDAPGHYYVRASISQPFIDHYELEWDVSPWSATRPAQYMPGDLLVDRITAIGADREPLVGLTFEMTGRGPSGEVLTTIPQPIEHGNGIYEVAYQTNRSDPPGHYYIQLVANDAHRQMFEVEWTTGVRRIASNAHSLMNIRRRVLARFGDLVTMRATRDGTTSTFIDHDSVVGEPGRFAAREAYFATGPNAGQIRYVESSSRDQSMLVFSRELPFITRMGDEIDVTNAYGAGSTFRAVNDAISYAIAISRDHALVPTAIEYPDRFDAMNYQELPVPYDIVGVDRVFSRRAPNEPWREVKRATEQGGDGWSLNRSDHTVILGGLAAHTAHDGYIKVQGYTLPAPLELDTDTTTIDIEWLVDAAASHLLLDTHLSRSNTQDWASKGLLYKQNADRLLPRLTPNLSPSFMRF